MRLACHVQACACPAGVRTRQHAVKLTAILHLPRDPANAKSKAPLCAEATSCIDQWTAREYAQTRMFEYAKTRVFVNDEK